MSNIGVQFHLYSFKQKNSNDNYIFKHLVELFDTMCPRSSDPFCIISYYKNGSLLLRHTVFGFTAFSKWLLYLFEIFLLI